jgi:Rrf2 family protein
MQISAKTEYACLAVLDLTTSYDDGEPLQIRKIAAAHQIPSGFLVQILLQLKTAGLVTSTRGAAGGYRLARSPDDITIWDVMCVIDGEGRGAMCAGRCPASGVLTESWERAAEASRDVLQSITFGQLADKLRDAAHGMYYI